MAVAGFGLALALFLGNNLPHLLSPDYSPDQARFARLVASELAGRSDMAAAAPPATSTADSPGLPGEGPDRTTSTAPPARIVSVNHYDLAFFYFLGVPPEMLTDSERFFTIVDTEPLLHRSHAVRLIPRDRLVTELASRPFYAITEPTHIPLFCGRENALCGRNGPFRIVAGDYLVLVTNTD